MLLFRHSRLWAVDYRFDGRPRRLWRTFSPDTEVAAAIADWLQQMHGTRARLLAVREATAEEEAAWLRDEQARVSLCPSGRAPRSAAFSAPPPAPSDEDPAPPH